MTDKRKGRPIKYKNKPPRRWFYATDEVWRWLDRNGNVSAEIERLVNKEREHDHVGSIAQ